MKNSLCYPRPGFKKTSVRYPYTSFILCVTAQINLDAYCLIHSSSMILPSSLANYRYGLKIVMSNLEVGDPFMVYALLLLCRTGIATALGHAPCGLFTLALNLCAILGIDRDMDILWASATGKMLADRNFCRTLWFWIYIQGYCGALSYGLPVEKTRFIHPETVANYQPPCQVGPMTET